MLPVSGSTAGDAHEARCWGTSLRYRLKRFSHTTLPLSASMATRRSCVFAGSPTGELRYNRPPNATGADRLPIGIRHARFSPFGDHAAGKFVSLERPSRDGPRHSGQSDATVTATAHAAIAAATDERRRTL